MNEFANAEHNRLLNAANGNAGYALMDACEQIAALTDSQFAPWQLARLPDSVGTMMIGNHACGNERNIVSMALAGDPVFTITTQASRSRAFLVDGDNGRPDSGIPTLRGAEEPAMSIRAGRIPAHRALLSQGRVVGMTPRALARFQTLPDWYELPAKNGLACRGIGNAVPPLLYEAVVRSLGVT